MKKILQILGFPIYCLMTFVVIMGIHLLEGLESFWKVIWNKENTP